MIDKIRRIFKIGTRTTGNMVKKPDPPKRVVPPVGSTVEFGGFVYRVRKVTDKDLVLRPIGIVQE